MTYKIFASNGQNIATINGIRKRADAIAIAERMRAKWRHVEVSRGNERIATL